MVWLCAVPPSDQRHPRVMPRLLRMRGADGGGREGCNPWDSVACVALFDGAGWPQYRMAVRVRCDEGLVGDGVD
ncbi:hypothetical protein Tco_0188958 [Tanacetum coccineum]